ncbi:MAG TPA: tetratricopeptide repeat protein [Puia sp.]|nr:tetratricopeptide repeat protein [Puia sp.]
MRNKKWIILIALFILAGSVLFAYRYVTQPKPGDKPKEKEVLAAFTNLEAYNQYLQGRNNWDRRDQKSLRKGIEFFNRAIQLDSNMSQAYAGLADCYTALGYGSYELPANAFLKAESAALHALKLDPTLADPHTSLGYIRFYYYWDWAGAEREFTKAIQLDPHYESAFDSYSYYLTAMERFPEAGVAIDKALQLNPLSVPINTDKGFSLYYSGHYQQAIKVLRSITGMNPKNPLAHIWLGRSYQELKMYKEAISEFQFVLGLNKNWPVALAALGYVYGISGQEKKAIEILDTLVTLRPRQYVTPYGIALIYASVKNKDKTFEWLEQAYIDRSNWLVWLKLDPRWLPVRSDERYKDLLAKTGLLKGSR